MNGKGVDENVQRVAETGRGSHLRPAIGLDATERAVDVDTVVAAARDATEQNFPVVAAIDASDARLRSRLQPLDVTALQLEAASVDVRRELIAAGKKMGVPGVLVHSRLDAAVRYEESYAAFLETTEYAVPAHVSEPTADAEVIAGIPGRVASADGVWQVRTHVDTVLVVGDTEAATQPLITEQDGVSVIEPDAGSETAAIQALFDHVEGTYTDYDAFVFCGVGEYDPGWIPDLTDALRTEDADLAVGQTQGSAEASTGSVYRRLKDHLQDTLTLGTAETAAPSLRPGLQALSPAAVARLDGLDEDAALGPQLLDVAISTDLSVSVTDTTDTDATSVDAVSETETDRRFDAEQAPTLQAGSASSGPAPGTNDAASPQRAGREANVVSEQSVTAPEGYIVGAESDITPVLSVVIPTMNEQEGIATCLDWVTEAVAELGVPTEIVVSDSSSDRTPEIARDKGAIVVEPDEPGYGYAYRYAFERVRGEYVVMGDADTTYDFSEIPRLLEHLESTGADIVMGSRLDGKIEPGAMPALHKYVGNPLLTGFLNTFYDAGVSDAHSGFRVFTRDALEALDLDSIGMEFASEMVMDASVKGLDIEEVPITYHERVGEETLDSFRDGWRHVRFMLVNAPGKLFSVPAVALLAVGFLMLALSWAGVGVRGVTFAVHTAIAGSLLTIVGYQVGMLGVFSTIAADPIKKPTDRLNEWVVDSVQLEHGLVIGGGVLVLGGGYAATMVGRWLASGTLPLVVPNLLAFTAIVVGMQTMFNAFCFSVLASTTDNASGDSRRPV